MNKDSFCLSSSGLQNINKEDTNFIFVFGEREIPINNLCAEFFSPLVSRLHLSDPTIDRYKFEYPSDFKTKMPKSEELISEDIINLIKQLSSGSKVSIKENQTGKLLIISILVDNEELFSEIINRFPKETNEQNLDIFIEYIQLIDSLLRLNKIKCFNLRPLIDMISSNFYLIDEKKMKELSKPLLLEILSNEKLRINNEDCLFDFIESIKKESSSKEEEEEVESETFCLIDFYEQIFISKLSEDKFKQLLLSINPSEMTTTFWQHICSRICEMEFKEDIPLNRYSHNSKKPKKDPVYAQTAIVCGFNKYKQLVIESNNKNKSACPIVSPPQNLSLDSSSYQSFSSYGFHTVEVTSDGSLKVIGENSNNQISASLPKSIISQFTDFCVRDSSGRQLTPVSAVCCYNGTVYMVRKSGGFGNQLVLCDTDINNGKEVFLDTGNQDPVSLFGGYNHAAAISSDGEVIFINRDSVKNSPSSRLASFSLPDGEKASSVACCNDSVFVLSSAGRVFSSVIEKGSSSLSFSAVLELSGQGIVCLSGTYNHCLCVSSEGRVFVRGSNSSGQLGLGEETKSVSSFTMISSLFGYKIRAAYAGHDHSLFETQEGKILSCGHNYNGELLLSSNAGDKVSSPRETMITSGATFCIAGFRISYVFIGGDPPPNTPNRRIQQQ